MVTFRNFLRASRAFCPPFHTHCVGYALCAFLLLMLSGGGPLSSCHAAEAQDVPHVRVGVTLGYADLQGRFPVTSVLYGTPADRGGLRVGDWIFPPAEAEASPEGIQNYLALELQHGFSVILRGEREGVPQTYWLRPYRFSASQEKLVALSLAVEKHILEGRSLWKEAIQAFDSFLYRSMSPEDLASRLSELRTKLHQAAWDLRNQSVPADLSPEIRTHFLAAREDYARAMELRREGLLYLMEYATHQQDPLSHQQGRRRETDSRARQARKLESRGGKELLFALRRGALSEKEIELLFSWERGFEAGESQHPQEFGDLLYPGGGASVQGALVGDGAGGTIRKEYAFLLTPPWDSRRVAYWAGEELLVFWGEGSPRYIFVWTGAMWYQIALHEGESPGEGLQRNRSTLKQQRQQNRFGIPQEDLPYLQSLAEGANLSWLGMLAW